MDEIGEVVAPHEAGILVDVVQGGYNALRKESGLPKELIPLLTTSLLEVPGLNPERILTYYKDAYDRISGTSALGRALNADETKKMGVLCAVGLMDSISTLDIAENYSDMSLALETRELEISPVITAYLASLDGHYGQLQPTLDDEDPPTPVRPSVLDIYTKLQKAMEAKTFKDHPGQTQHDAVAFNLTSATALANFEKEPPKITDFDNLNREYGPMAASILENVQKMYPEGEDMHNIKALMHKIKKQTSENRSINLSPEDQALMLLCLKMRRCEANIAGDDTLSLDEHLEEILDDYSHYATFASEPHQIMSRLITQCSVNSQRYSVLYENHQEVVAKENAARTMFMKTLTTVLNGVPPPMPQNDFFSLSHDLIMVLPKNGEN